MRIALNGTLVGPIGYMRGYVGRMDPGFAEPANTYLLAPNDDKRETSCYQTMPCAPRHRGPAITAPNTRCCQPPQDISLPCVTKRTAMCPSQRAVQTSHRTAVQY